MWGKKVALFLFFHEKSMEIYNFQKVKYFKHLWGLDEMLKPW